MQSSPLQLKSLYYKHALISPVRVNDEDMLAEEFDFDGVIVQDAAKAELIPPTAEGQIPVFYVGLRIAIKNEDGKKCPYSIDLEMIGLIEIQQQNLTELEMENLALINGCSIIYSTIREFVMNFTSRCLGGMLILPTVNFLDKKKNVTPSPSKKETKPTPKKRISKPKEKD